MVNVGDKTVTRRSAHAVAVVTLPGALAALLRDGEIATKKGPLFQTAILAGVMGAKKTSELIPLCHPLSLDDCQIEITPTTDKVKIKISDVPAHQNATVFLAITENDLVSNRRSGANPAHTSVVRSLSSLGMLPATQKSLEIETALPTQPEWKKDNLKIVVFVQDNVSRKVLGVNRKSLS